MLLPKTLNFIGMAAALLFATALADDPQKPLDKSRFIGEPICLNPNKHDSGLDKENACQEAIDALERQKDGITRTKGICKELSRAGNCIVAICHATNTQTKLDPKLIASVAQDVHGYCKVGPIDDRWTGGSTFTYGLEPWDQDQFGATIYVGQFYAAPRPQLGSCGRPTCENRRALAAKRALEILSPRTPPLTKRSMPKQRLTTRAVGDTAPIGGDWIMRVEYVGEWQASIASAGHLNALGDMLVRNWNEVQGPAANRVTASSEPDPDYRLIMGVTAAGHHQVHNVDQNWRTEARRVFRDLWIRNGRPGYFSASIIRVTPLNDGPTFSYNEIYAYMDFLEGRNNRGGFQIGTEWHFTGAGIHYGSTDRIV